MSGPKKKPRLLKGGEIRERAAAMALRWAAERERDGDVEGAGALADLSEALREIPLRAES